MKDTNELTKNCHIKSKNQIQKSTTRHSGKSHNHHHHHHYPALITLLPPFMCTVHECPTNVTCIYCLNLVTVLLKKKDLHNTFFISCLLMDGQLLHKKTTHVSMRQLLFLYVLVLVSCLSLIIELSSVPPTHTIHIYIYIYIYMRQVLANCDENVV